MFKFVVLSALVALSAAAPSGLELSSPYGLGLAGSPWGASSLGHSSAVIGHQPIIAHQPLIAKQILTSQPVVSSYSQPAVTGAVVQHVPTAVSHQSQSIVHHDKIVTPVVTPVQKTIVSHVPVVNTIAAPGPITYSAAPVALNHGWNAGLSHGWNAAPIALSHGWNGASSHGLEAGWSSPALSSW